MRKAIYPGTFDPITLGHLDIIKRASTLVDQLEVVIMRNPNKSNSDFSVEDRLEMISSVIQEFSNVTVSAQTGLTVEYAKVSGANILIRGIRAVMDYEYELQQATANMVLAPNIETVFLLTRPQYSFLSSSVVKQIAQNKGDLTPFVPSQVKEFIEKKYR